MVKRYKRKPGDIKRLKSIKADEYKGDVAKLRALRKKAKLTQRQLAAMLGESQTWVSNVERGQRRIDIYEARRWKDACLRQIAKLAALEAAAASVAGGASTSQPAGMSLPLAAEPRKPLAAGKPPAAAPARPADAPQRPRVKKAPPHKPERD